MRTLLGLLLCTPPIISGCGPIAADEKRTAVGRTSPAVDENRVTLEHAFGLVRPGAELRHRFRLRNTTDRPWTVGRIDPGCSCTSVGLSRRKIGPGQEALAEVTFKAGNEVGDRSAGVRITMDGPGAPEVFLGVTASVRRELTCHPQEAALTDRVRSAVLHAFNYSGEKWDSLVATSSAEWLSVRCELADEAGDAPRAGVIPRQAWRVRVAARENVPSGTGSALVRFSVPGRDYTADVAVQYRDEPAIQVAPSQVFFGECEPGREVTKKVAVLFREGEAPASPSELVVKPSPGVPVRSAWSSMSGKRWTLALTFSPEGRPGPVGGEISIGPRRGGEVVRVPFTAVVRPR